MKDYLIKNYKNKTKKELAQYLNVSYSKIEWELKKLKLTKFKHRNYTEEEIEFIKTNFPIYGATYCAEKLGRSMSALSKKAAKLGVKRQHSYEYISYQGYKVDCKDRNKKILIHRRIMEEHLGRKLSSNEIVHHIDGNKLNNDINNLEVVSRSEHIKKHFYNNK